jgi:hypothetical protein
MILHIGTCVVAVAALVKTADHWTNETLPALIQGNEGRNIFSADETALFYSLMPSKSLHMKGETYQGGKKSKENLTVLLCSSADGSEKLKPLVIGKLANMM